MAAFKGSALKIKKSGVVICSGINQKDITFNAELIDDTAGSNRGYRVTLAETDTKSLDISFKGIAKDRVLRKLRLNDANFLENITIEFANGDTVVGNFVMNAYSESNTFKDAVQFSCGFQSAGAYTHTFSTTENDDGSPGGVPSEPVGPVSGDLKILGRFISERLEEAQVVGGLPAVAFTYNIFTGLMENIYQRKKIMLDSVELSGMAICAINGSFAICCELEGGKQYVAISHYKTNAACDSADDWHASQQINNGTDYNPIDCGGFWPRDILMLENGSFIISSQVNAVTPLRDWPVIIIAFEDGKTFTDNRVVISLDDLALPDFNFTNDQMRVSVDIENPETVVTLVYAVFYDADPVYKRIETIINTADASIVSQVVTDVIGYIDVNDTALQVGNAGDAKVMGFVRSDFYYKSCHFSFNGIHIYSDYTSYGQNLLYKEYTDRSVTDDLVEFVEGSEIVISMGPLVENLLTSHGFSLGGGSIPLGAMTGYVE